METSIVSEIRRIQAMTVSQLQAEWTRLYLGETCRSRNRPFIVKRLCWRLQELRLGGLSERAKAWIALLAPEGFVRAVTPPNALPEAEIHTAPPKPKTIRDIRLPSPGSVISRTWHGRELRLRVLEDGFELDGVRYGSLSEAARVSTGAHWNGKLFWGLTQRKRKR